MSKRKQKPSSPSGEKSAFKLTVARLSGGVHILGTRGASFVVFTSAADAATYLRQAADGIEAAWADYVKELGDAR